jgi:hypothetical protein
MEVDAVTDPSQQQVGTASTGTPSTMTSRPPFDRDARRTPMAREYVAGLFEVPSAENLHALNMSATTSASHKAQSRAKASSKSDSEEDSYYTEEGDKPLDEEISDTFIYDKFRTIEKAFRQMQDNMNDFMIKLQINMDEKFSKLEDKIFLDTKHDDFMHMVGQKFVKMQEHFTKISALPRVNIDLLHVQSLNEKDDIFTIPTLIEIPENFSIEHDAT